jgi:hypothetical protein
MLPAVRQGARCHGGNRIRLASTWSGAKVTAWQQPWEQKWHHNRLPRHRYHRAFSNGTDKGSLTASTRQFFSNATPFSTAIFAALTLVFGGAMGARWFYSSAVERDSILLNSKTGAPRQDRSKVTIALPASTLKLQQPSSVTKATEHMLLSVDIKELQECTKTWQAAIEIQQQQAKQQTQQILHEQLAVAFQDCRSRGVSQFARWYFSYSTTYSLLSIAMKSATKHALTTGRNESTLQQAVTRDLQLYICDKYQAMVLRPAVTDPKIHKAVLATLEQVYEQSYQPAVNELETAVQQFAQGHAEDALMEIPKTTSRLALPPGAVVLELDWKAQLQKAVHLPVAYEKRPAEFSVAIIGAGAMAGKAMGGTAVKAVSAKLAAPFAAKAVGTTLGGKTAAGAALGGVLAGGPLGAGMGAAIGIGMDMAVNKSISLLQQSTFEKDVQESLDATMLEWEEKILPEVDSFVQEEWFQQLQTIVTTLSAKIPNVESTSF